MPIQCGYYVRPYDPLVLLLMLSCSFHHAWSSDTRLILPAGSCACKPADDTSPCYWSFEDLPVGDEVAIRVSGEGLTPTVWRGVVPSGTATWLNGVLYAYEFAIYEEFFASIDGFQGLTFPSLVDSEHAMLWGEPLYPEDWVGAEITVTDGDGVEHSPVPHALNFAFALKVPCGFHPSYTVRLLHSFPPSPVAVNIE